MRHKDGLVRSSMKFVIIFFRYSAVLGGLWEALSHYQLLMSRSVSVR